MKTCIAAIAALGAALVCVAPANAQALPDSDSIRVDIPQVGAVGLFPVPELADGSEGVATVVLAAPIFPFGFIDFFEPDGTLSDRFINDGQTLRLFSDGSPNFPPVTTLPPIVAAGFIEDGKPLDISGLFSLPLATGGPGGPPLTPGQLVVFSDANVPEPATVTLLAVGLLGLVGYARRRKKLAAA